MLGDNIMKPHTRDMTRTMAADAEACTHKHEFASTSDEPLDPFNGDTEAPLKVDLGLL